MCNASLLLASPPPPVTATQVATATATLEAESASMAVPGSTMAVEALQFQVGDQVSAAWEGDNTSYDAVVRSVYQDDTVLLVFNDDNKTQRTRKADITKMGPRKRVKVEPASTSLRDGTNASVRPQAGGEPGRGAGRGGGRGRNRRRGRARGMAQGSGARGGDRQVATVFHELALECDMVTLQDIVYGDWVSSKPLRFTNQNSLRATSHNSVDWAIDHNDCATTGTTCATCSRLGALPTLCGSLKPCEEVVGSAALTTALSQA